MYPRNKFLTILLAAAAIALSSCGGAKLATANEQMERGEYFDASRTYRKVYNKLTKREDRHCVAKWLTRLPSVIAA